MATSTTGSQKLDGVIETAKAKTPEKPTGLALYSRFALAGAICCSVTHGGLTPVDVLVSCNMNLSQSNGNSDSILHTASRLGFNSTRSPTTVA